MSEIGEVTLHQPKGITDRYFCTIHKLHNDPEIGYVVQLGESAPRKTSGKWVAFLRNEGSGFKKLLYVHDTRDKAKRELEAAYLAKEAE